MLRQPLESDSNEPITDQDNELLAKFKEYRYGPEKMTWDPNCYECKVRYRDPKAKDLVMYLHAWRYKVIYFPHSSKIRLIIEKMNYPYPNQPNHDINVLGTRLAISNAIAGMGKRNDIIIAD